jgi:hypothetical protein
MPAQIVDIITILVFALPILVTSTILVWITRAIRSIQNQYKIQMMVFRGILAVAYVFFIAGLALLIEETCEIFGLTFVATIARFGWHAATLMGMVILTLSFLQYLNVLRHQT